MAVFHPASGGTLSRGVAGAELNVALALARLGRAVTYATRVGDDPFGATIRERLEEAGVHGRVAVDPERPTGVYFRDSGDDSSRHVFYYRAGSAASALAPVDLPPLEDFALVHATGITAALSPSCLDAVRAAAAGARRFTLDVNFRAALWSPERCREALLPLCAAAEVVFASDDDCAAVAPEDALTAGAGAVVHTHGADGADWLAADGARVHAAAPSVDAVDSVGAGDAFAAGFLHAWLDGSDPSAALEAGCRLGAETAAVVGDQR
jgi:2-dehydro-3-deoxygluconokinase